MIKAQSEANRCNELRHHLERDKEENRPEDVLEVLMLATSIVAGAGVIGSFILFLIWMRWL